MAFIENAPEQIVAAAKELLEEWPTEMIFSGFEIGISVRPAKRPEDDLAYVKQLEAEGFKVLHAASAEAALVLAVQQPLSLITLDIMLPKLDGLSLLRQLRKEGVRIPVIILSAKASVDDRHCRDMEVLFLSVEGLLRRLIICCCLLRTR